MTYKKNELVEAFEKVPNNVYKWAFDILNILLLVTVLLVAVDYALPRTVSNETVTGVEEVEYERKGNLYSYFVLHTTGPSTDISNLLDEYDVAQGDTLEMTSSPILHLVYGLQLKDKGKPCCEYDSYSITLVNKTEFLVVCGIGLVLLFVGMIPKLSYANRLTAAFFAYVMLYVGYKYFMAFHF